MHDDSQTELDDTSNNVAYKDKRPLEMPLEDRLKEQAARDKIAALGLVLKAWQEQQKQERELRGVYAGRLIYALFAQILAVNAAFFLIGTQCLKVDEWTARIFIMAVFSELAGMVFFIVKYLFAKADGRIFELIEKLHVSQSG